MEKHITVLITGKKAREAIKILLIIFYSNKDLAMLPCQYYTAIGKTQQELQTFDNPEVNWVYQYRISFILENVLVEYF